MTLCVKRRVFLQIVVSLVSLFPVGAYAATGLCERLLANGTLRAAYYEINIGNGDDTPGVGDVIVIRNGDTEKTYDPNKPELDIGGGGNGVETGNDRPVRRPDVDIPHVEPGLQEIVPERKDKDKDKLPAILPLIDPREIARVPVKKPTKPLLN
jgi:hypothetical protein